MKYSELQRGRGVSLATIPELPSDYACGLIRPLAREGWESPHTCMPSDLSQEAAAGWCALWHCSPFHLQMGHGLAPVPGPAHSANTGSCLSLAMRQHLVEGL
jgi:hypothetical protein